MGSKNLKAVAVRGNQPVLLAHPDSLKTLPKEIVAEVNAAAEKGLTLRLYGTAYVPSVTNEMGILPTHNFQTGVFDNVEDIVGPRLREKYLIRPIACGRLTRVNEPPYVGETGTARL